MSKAAAASHHPTTRLHITPFSPALLDSIIPRTRQSLATSISYHKTQSDPDKGFGYIELPSNQADKLRSKLNGAILKGSKMSIEKARPEKRKAAQKDAEPETERPQKKAKKQSKSKDVNKEISGVELPTDRKVKRGWTDPNVKATKKSKETKDSKDVKREKSKYTDKEELLFRTGKKVEETKSKTKIGSKSSSSKPLVVHEFEKSTKVPTFIKQAALEQDSKPTTFVDGQGWVDEEGNVVEAVRSTRRTATTRQVGFSSDGGALGIKGLETKPRSTLEGQSAAPQPKDGSDSSTVSSDSEISSDSESDSDSDSDSDASSSSSEASESSVAQRMTPPTALDPVDGTGSKFVSEPLIAPSTEAPTPALNGTETEDAAFQKPIHPLEALYKRRPEDLPKPAPIKTSFSFFEADNDEPVPKVESNTIPQTPFTQQDLRFRGIRSAAPTPDTAVASRKFFADMDDDEEEEDEQHETPNMSRSADVADTSSTTNEKSAWKRGFYERRSELNQSWKQRRRDAMKQQRQRETRRLSRRAL
ncbi:hypothetical protein KVT40_005890 [Elsinoe batatas]|uniref:Suppressor protein SRP40 n=1 Tax=Elsinoe batatas TaxID=2601811 RepID=A0A8K0L134_9PEZI|nr:hypothetical protein KVT40_005890 [Elsinoe batatas]